MCGFHKVRISELWREGNWPSAVVCCCYRGRGGYIGPWWPPFFNISKRAGRDAGYEIERRENGRAIRKIVWQKAQTAAFRLFSSREFFCIYQKWSIYIYISFFLVLSSFLVILHKILYKYVIYLQWLIFVTVLKVTTIAASKVTWNNH